MCRRIIKNNNFENIYIYIYISYLNIYINICMYVCVCPKAASKLVTYNGKKMKEEYTHTAHIHAHSPAASGSSQPSAPVSVPQAEEGKRKGQRCRKSTHPWSSGLARIREKVRHVNGHGQHNAEVAVCNEQLSRLCLLYTLEN